MKILAGAIVSCNADNRVYRYLAEDRGRIVFVGDILPDGFPLDNMIELGDKALLPAFWDTHLHFSSFAFFNANLDVRYARSFDNIAHIIRTYSAGTDTFYIVGFGISPFIMKEKRMITKDELSDIEPKRPLMLVKYDGHACVINQCLAERLPQNISSFRGYDGNTGVLTQEAFYAASGYVANRLSPFSLLHNMLEGFNWLAKKGVSGIHAAEGVGFVRDLDIDLMRFVAQGLHNNFQVRLFFQTLDIKKVLKRKLPRIGGCFAAALDGCFGSADAALNDPYRHDPASKGVLYYPTKAIQDFVIRAHHAGLQIQLHAIGDAAFDQAVTAFDTALQVFPRDDHRHAIIHASLPTLKGLETCARLGIGLAVQPEFVNWRLEPLDYLETILGERVQQMLPFRAMKDMGILLSGGSDAPCTEPDPIAGIYSACNHFLPEQSLTIPEALKLYTLDAAKMTFDEDERGSLEIGKIADMIIVNRNPLEMQPQDLHTLSVESLYLSGKPYQPEHQLLPLVKRYLWQKKDAFSSIIGKNKG